MRARLLTSWTLAVALSSPLHDSIASDRLSGQPFATRSPVTARHGMVCASQPLAAQVGVDILKRGGSAVDAAIAVNAMLGLTEPVGCGIGGDLFVIGWDPEGERLYGLNGSGRSPQGLTLDELKRRLDAEGSERIPLRSGLAVSVPGAVDGWFTLHERYGRLPMSELLAPAIRYAREGFPLTQVIAYYWSFAPRTYADFDEFGRTYLPGGAAPAEGEIFRNPNLADTYEAIARGGRDAFYTGPIAEDVVAAVNAHGGAFALSDLSEHRSEWVDPVSVGYRGYDVWELPPNGQGIAALQLLQMLEPYDVAGAGFYDPLVTHVTLEAKKLVYEDRATFYADMATADVPLEGLLDPAYAASRRALIDEARAATDLAPGDPSLERGDTVYFTIADDDGHVVSWIQSNYTGFGSGIVPEGRGFTLQNRGNLFHLDPGHRNAFAPGKRPFHTIIPAMMTKDGAPVLSFGVMGGAMQPQGHAQVVINMVDHGMNVQEAGDAPRWRHDGSAEPTGEPRRGGGVVNVESGVPEATVEWLRAAGHEVRVRAGGYGGYQGIWIDHAGDAARRVYRGGSESRKDGMAIGY